MGDRMKGQPPASHNTMPNYNKINDSSQRRRSPRLTSPLVDTENNKMARDSSAPVKRFITVRKIAPRKTTAAAVHDKENTPRRSEGSQPKRQKIPSPGGLSTPSTPVQPGPQQPAEDPRDVVWSQKARRSYTRISDKSFNSPDDRETLFGFEMLQTPEVGRKVGRANADLEVSSTASGPSSLISFILDAEDCGPDLDIPGVALAKKKKKSRKKVQKIDVKELDALSAKMNAEFQEAEQFELVVE